jgi:hypothetical protein
MDSYNKLIELLEEAKKDANKAYDKENISAGIRVRKTMQEIKDLAQEVRKEIAEIRKAKEGK